MKDCVKQTELTNGTPAHVANLTKLEILYRQLQQRHQYDLEQHFAISESLKFKAKDAQVDLQKLERQCEEMRAQFDEEQTKSAAKVSVHPTFGPVLNRFSLSDRRTGEQVAQCRHDHRPDTAITIGDTGKSTERRRRAYATVTQLDE